MDKKPDLKLIALLTDFGTRDYFVGAMKGVIFSINPHAQIVDITHEIESQNITAASFTLRACYKNFPVKTVFVAVVDPGVGSRRKAILVETADYYFIAPDNGLLSFIFNGKDNFAVFDLTNEKFFAAEISTTFHGRDVFAPVAAHLSNGAAAGSFGVKTGDYVQNDEIKPRRISAEKIEAVIIHADRFGNLVTNLTRGDLPENFAVEINGTTINRRRNFFAEAAPGELLMIFGSADFLEIVAFQDSARKILNAEIGRKIVVTNS